MKKIKAIAAVAACALSMISSPTAAASLCVSLSGWVACQRPWDGQLQQSWNTPGYYGGWTTGPVMCDPLTTQCRGWAQP